MQITHDHASTGNAGSQADDRDRESVQVSEDSDAVEKYRFLPEYEGSTLDEQSTPEYERYGTDLSRAVRFTC